jgi:hypothetical protein
MPVDEGSDERAGRGLSTRAQAIVSCIIMLILIGVLLLAMGKAPPSGAGALPKEAATNVPDQKLRIVACDVQQRHLQDDPVLKQINALHPDYLILQNITEPDAEALAGTLKLHLAFRAAAGADGSTKFAGNCVLSSNILSPAESAGGMGMWTTSRVASRQLVIASIDVPLDAGAAGTDQLLAGWQQLGSPPIILAGRFPRNFSDNDPVHLRSGWFDALSSWERLLPSSPIAEGTIQILLSPGWSCTAGGTITGYTLAPSWIEASSSALATAPTTQAATQPDDD